MGKEGRGHWRLTELKWSVWRWSMTTALWGRTSLEPQQETNENAEPCLAGLFGPISEVISNVWRPWPVKDIKIKTFTIHSCWFHLPWPANPKQERNGINYKRRVQDAGWNPQVCTYKLWLRKGLPLGVLTSYFLQFTWYGATMMRYKWVINIFKFEKQLQMIRNTLVLNRPELFHHTRKKWFWTVQNRSALFHSYKTI